MGEKMRLLRLLGVVLVMNLVLLGSGGDAMAHRKAYATTTSTTFAEDNVPGFYFIGGSLITSGKCLAGRTVVLWEVAGSAPLDSDLTDATGQWSMDDASYAGGVDYYVFIFERVIKRRGHKHVCKAGTSPNFDPAG